MRWGRQLRGPASKWAMALLLLVAAAALYREAGRLYRVM